MNPLSAITPKTGTQVQPIVVEEGQSLNGPKSVKEQSVALSTELIVNSSLRASTVDLNPSNFGQLIPIESESILPGFDKQPLCLSGISAEEVVFVHLTDEPPTNCEILSIYHRTHGGLRFTNHFSMNHAVCPNQAANWDKGKYGMFILGDAAIALNGSPKAGHEVDIFWTKPFKFNSPRAVLVIHDKSVPAGMFKVVPAHEAKISPECKCLILATSEYPANIAERIIAKMGRTHIPSGTML